MRNFIRGKNELNKKKKILYFVSNLKEFLKNQLHAFHEIFQSTVYTVYKLSYRLFDELDSINGNDIMGYERFLEKCEKILHKNNYLCLSALHCLSQIYGKIDGYLINDLSDSHLKRKIEICEKLIKIFAKLEPGLSKQRGLSCRDQNVSLKI